MIGGLKARLRYLRPGWKHRQAGDAARAAGDWTTAAQAYARYLAIRPNDAAIWVQCGHARKESGDTTGAERAYRRAVAADPQAADPPFQLGALLRRLDRRDEALDLYRSAARLGHTPAAQELAAMGVGPEPDRLDPTHLRLLLDAQAARDLHRWTDAERLYMAYLAAVPEAIEVRVELDAARRHKP